MPAQHPAVAEISKSALEHNLKVIRQHAGASPVWGVIKANAYGHRVEIVLPIIAPHVDGVACARFNEALEIQTLMQQHQINLPILILGGTYALDEMQYAQEHGFQLACHSQEQIQMLKQLKGKPLKVWVELNSRMNRLGFLPSTIKAAFEELHAAEAVDPIGVMAHLGTADEPQGEEAKLQVERCQQVFADLRQKYPALLTSLSNSAHLLSREELDSYSFQKQATDWVRPGICLYGSTPFADKTAIDLNLKPVMTLKSRIVSHYKIKKGETVGYGATWSAPSDGELFIIAFGYGDGYPRHMQEAYVISKDVQLQKAGRVSMDLSAYFYQGHLDNGPSVGDYVELWGNQISVDDVAAWSSSIGYERLTQIKGRVEYSVIE
ncbi:MAG TPA: alanine racemase [Gammaproteobacteria bacterium]|nr:alanine racemase [Gammaproteobacteria bacterium]